MSLYAKLDSLYNDLWLPNKFIFLLIPISQIKTIFLQKSLFRTPKKKKKNEAEGRSEGERFYTQYTWILNLMYGSPSSTESIQNPNFKDRNSLKNLGFLLQAMDSFKNDFIGLSNLVYEWINDFL